ncbi:hypothetical protein GE09DRAFT_1257553 [Coniochaeta sp. 2T2.1]|nr:hypothetical protein GE09DRAFT_1257553 [Coniochaeta sp. 2T2.1]
MASSVKQAVLCILGLVAAVYTNPLPTPPPLQTGTATAGEVGPLATPNCTTVLTSLVTGFHGDFTAKVAKTIYTETVTEHEWVACGGCGLSITTELAKNWAGYGPQQIITATTTARHATTTTLTACSRHSDPPSHGQIPRDVNDPEASSSGECTSTKVIIPNTHRLDEGDKTLYPTTATTTSHVDCGGCNYIALSTADFLHPGPMVLNTAMTTASTPATETAYVCLKSPSVVLPPSSSHGTRPATTPTSPPASPTAEITIHKTITKTIYASTVTLVKTATCGPMRGPGSQTSQGAIPRRDDITTEKKTHSSSFGTRTVYSTLELSTSAVWTRTSFHCVGRRPTPTSTPVHGEPEPLAIGERKAVTTKPPTHRPLPVSPTLTSITITLGHS